MLDRGRCGMGAQAEQNRKKKGSPKIFLAGSGGASQGPDCKLCLYKRAEGRVIGGLRIQLTSGRAIALDRGMGSAAIGRGTQSVCRCGRSLRGAWTVPLGFWGGEIWRALSHFGQNAAEAGIGSITTGVPP